MQGTLFDDYIELADFSKELKYHLKHPELYEYFERFTFEAIRRGKRHVGAKQIIELMRWESRARADGEQFKVWNDAGTFYARLFMKKHPEHAGLFITRESKVKVPDVIKIKKGAL